MSLTHIETIELGSSQSSITFSSIPQDYDDLVLVGSARSDASAVEDNMLHKPNNSTLNRSKVILGGNGSSAFSSSNDPERLVVITGNTSTANTFGNFKVYFSNYTGSQNKSYSSDAVNENNATSALGIISAHLWSDSSAITSLVFEPNTGTNFLTGTVMSLYGVTAGGDGTVSTA